MNTCRICRLTTNHSNQTLQTGSFGFLASFGAAPAAAAPAAPASSANFSKSKASNTAEAAFLFERGIHGSFGGACKAKHLQARFIAHLCISDLCTPAFWVKCTRKWLLHFHANYRLEPGSFPPKTIEPFCKLVLLHSPALAASKVTRPPTKDDEKSLKHGNSTEASRDADATKGNTSQHAEGRIPKFDTYRKGRASWAAPGTSKPCHPSWSFCQEPLTASPPIPLQDSLSPVSPCTRGIKHRPQSVFQD